MMGVILAGGYGKRLRPLTNAIPKSMVKIAGRPIIEWELLWLRHFGIRSFLLLVGYRREKLVDYVDRLAAKLHVDVRYSVERTPLGTAGALRNAARLIDGDEFLVTNGDNIIDIDVTRMRLGPGLVCIAIKPLRVRGGLVKLEKDMIVDFDKAPFLRGFYVNAGVYLMRRDVLGHLPKKGNLEKEVFPKLAKQRRVSATRFDTGYFRDVNDTKDFEEISKEVSSNDMDRRLSRQ
jgi:NDP-sugar pyrophosphorylase family protein